MNKIYIMLITLLLISSTFSITTSFISKASTLDEENIIYVYSPEEKTAIIHEAENMDSETSSAQALSNIDDLPTSLNRVILITDDFSSSYGAEKIIYYKDYDEYTLCYSDEETTSAAYKKLLSIYGNEHCFLDDYIELSSINSSDSISFDCMSWGGHAMGLETLKKQFDSMDIDTQVNVAVIDSGISLCSSIFDNRINYSSSYDFIYNDTDLSDEIGHGTHVAGIIADTTPPNVLLTICKAFSESDSSLSMVRSAIEHAINSNVDIINLSFDSTSSTDSRFDDLLQTAYDSGIVLCAAAGNKAGDVENSYPANSIYTLAISSISNQFTFDSSFSNFGDEIDFCAPGNNILSTVLNGCTDYGTGTSMSAPHISAAAAYVKMCFPSFNPSQIKDKLIEYSVDLGTLGWDKYYGYGYPCLSTFFSDINGVSSLSTPKPVISNTYSGLKIKWNSISNATGYRIFRRENATGSFKWIKSVNSETLSFIDVATKPGCKYSYTVRAYCKNKDDTETNSNYCSSNICYRICQPSYKVANSSNGITIAWSKVAGANTYYICRKTVGSSKWSCIKASDTSSTSYVDTTVKVGQKYIYTVRASLNTTGNVKYYSSYNTSGLTMYRLTPRNIYSLFSNTSGYISMKWERQISGTGYQIRYSSTSSFSNATIITIKNNMVGNRNIPNLTKGKKYYFQVRSYKNVNGINYFGSWGKVSSYLLKS